MGNSSYWTESDAPPRFSALARNLTVDVLVIGGGLMGVTTAYLLSRAGRKVALIERGRLASVDTANTTAHLTSVMDLRLSDLAKTFGDSGARALWDAGEVSIQRIFEIATECDSQCQLSRVPGYLHAAAATEPEMEKLQSDATVASRLGIRAELVHEVPLFRKPGLHFPNQARFHPLNYVAGMVKAIRAHGGLIFEESAAEEFSKDGHTIRVGSYGIHAEKIVLATHTPLTGNADLLGATLFQTKLYLYTSYAACVEVPKRSIPDCLFWDTLDPYNYLRIQPGQEADYVIYGGKDHKTGQVEDTESVFAALDGDLNRLLAQHSIQGDPMARWSGQVIETNDGAPFIGETAPNQFAATGFSGNGMTFGTLAAMMATDWVDGRANPWTDLLSPSRKKFLGGTLDYIKENVDFPYYMLRDRVRAADSAPASEVKPGEGRILQVDGERLAVYRTDSGDLVKLSAVCPHMGCVVNWNDAESTWDCPCHGSRFHPAGEVLSGPAESPLEKK